MTYSNHDLKQLMPMVNAVAFQVSRHRSVKGFVEAPDIAQVIWEWILRNEAKLERWYADLDDDSLDRICGAVFRDVGIGWARREKATRLGYKTGDEFWYTKAMLVGGPGALGLLHHVYDDESWTSPPKMTGGGRSGKSLDEGFGWVATLTDISRALDTLEPKERELLRQVFGKQAPRQRLADEMYVSRKTIDNRTERAVTKLWEALGGPKWLTSREDREDGMRGHRPVVGNRQAVATIANQEAPRV